MKGDKAYKTTFKIKRFELGDTQHQRIQSEIMIEVSKIHKFNLNTGLNKTGKKQK